MIYKIFIVKLLSIKFKEINFGGEGFENYRV